MDKNIVKGEFILGFIYDNETNVLAPTITTNIKGKHLPFEVVFRLAASFTEHVLDERRKINYGTDDREKMLDIAYELRNKGGDE